MDIRERFFAAMRRQRGDFVPFSFSLCPSLRALFKEKTGREDYEAYYDFPMRGVGARTKLSADRFLPWYPNAQAENIRISADFGFGERSAGFEHFTQQVFPLANAETVADIEAFPLPTAADYDWEAVRARTREIKDTGRIAAAMMQITIFESSWYLRGMEEFLTDMIVEPEMCETLLERITVIREGMAEEYAKAGCDVLSLGDDVGTQLDMMIAPAKWRELLKPRLARVIAAARRVKPDILVAYHSDGNVAQIVPELIEAGVDILNPIQPECMDAAELKSLYGDRLSFWGGLGTQSTMPFGTADDVRKACENLIETVGKGGGLFLSPTHLLEPEVPWENIEAFLDVVISFNNRA